MIHKRTKLVNFSSTGKGNGPFQWTSPIVYWRNALYTVAYKNTCERITNMNLKTL